MAAFSWFIRPKPLVSSRQNKRAGNLHDLLLNPPSSTFSRHIFARPHPPPFPTQLFYIPEFIVCDHQKNLPGGVCSFLPVRPTRSVLVLLCWTRTIAAEALKSCSKFSQEVWLVRVNKSECWWASAIIPNTTRTQEYQKVVRSYFGHVIKASKLLRENYWGKRGQ